MKYSYCDLGAYMTTDDLESRSFLKSIMNTLVQIVT